MDRFPVEIQDYIFEMTDVKTCILNDKHHIVKKLYDKGAKLIWQTDPRVVEYYFQNMLPKVVKEFKLYSPLVHPASDGNLQVLQLYIHYMQKHRIYTKAFKWNIKRAFERACCNGHMEIIEYLFNTFPEVVSKGDLRWISEKVTSNNKLQVIKFLHSKRLLWHSSRGIARLKLINADQTLAYIQSIKEHIPCSMYCHRT